MPESFNTNNNYKISFLNSQHENTNLKGFLNSKPGSKILMFILKTSYIQK